jgi:raffinose/stachyose/melibiose transport system substrate-binding protein
MKLKRPFIAALAAIAAVTAVSGCASGPAAEDGKSLVIWNYEDENSAMGQAWQRAVEIFEEEHPDVDVKFAQQAFTSTKTNAQVLLSGNDVPDVMEFNKGAAGAGQLASQGLITPLTDAVEEYGWEDVLGTPSLSQLSRYTTDGVPGDGDWYGIPNYGEFVLWYYNKDFFAEHGLEVPETRAELDQLLDDIKELDVVPVAAAAKEFPYIHTWFQYVLRDAPADWVDCYQLLQCDVDFDADYWLDGTAAAEALVKDGYTSPNITGITHEQMGVNFLSGKSPLLTSGSWWFGRLGAEAKFDWDVFAWPEQNLNQGSVGNLWVVPTKAKNKELAYEFIDITLRPEVQNILGEKGGLPIAGDPSAITDERTAAFTAMFQQLADEDRLALYPDFPFPGYFEELLKDSQTVANGSKSPEEVVDIVQKFYEDGLANQAPAN